MLLKHPDDEMRANQAKEEKEREALVVPSPEDSVYFHPTLNPYGQPPPGQPQKWRVPFADPLASANLQR